MGKGAVTIIEFSSRWMTLLWRLTRHCGSCFVIAKHFAGVKALSYSDISAILSLLLCQMFFVDLSNFEAESDCTLRDPAGTDISPNFATIVHEGRLRFYQFIASSS
mgnify:CR=1 FL=1